MSAGIFGLMDAINAFDLDRGVKFETYCAPRIRGAILDELRSMDWVLQQVPFSAAQRFSTASKATGKIEDKLLPGSDERGNRQAAQSPHARVRERWQRTPSAVGLFPLSRKKFETDTNNDVREIDVLEDKRDARSRPRRFSRT